MVGTAGGRPRDKHLDSAILAAARHLLAEGSYNDLSMESVAAHAGVGKKTLYRRWSSKASLVAEAVVDAYGREGSFHVANSGDLAADLRSWLVEHAEFIDNPVNAALIRALIAASAAQPVDNEDLHRKLSVPQHAGLRVRLQAAVADSSLDADADIDAIADAVIGTLLLRVLNPPPRRGHRPEEFDGLINALLRGSNTLQHLDP